jgi:hypothetical protein
VATIRLTAQRLLLLFALVLASLRVVALAQMADAPAAVTDGLEATTAQGGTVKFTVNDKRE